MTALFYTLMFLLPLRAQQQGYPPAAPSAPNPFAPIHVRGNLYQTTGSVGNAFFYVGKEETLIIDATITTQTAKMLLSAIKGISDKPIRRVILTHSDGDHVNGLAAFPPNLTIISHENTRQLMADANKTAPVKIPLPNVTFKNDLSLFMDDVEIRLLYFGPAHTSGDIAVLFPAEKAVIVGDLIFIGRDPLVHRAKNGSSFGLIAALKAVLQLDADIYLSGHSEPVNRKTVENLLAMIEEKQARVKALAQEGKSLEDVKRIMGVEDAPARPGGRRWQSLVEVIFLELTEKKE